MATTYELINSNVLSSSAASVTFSSIPATYDDLVLQISARTNASGSVNDSIEITFNSDTSSVYSTRIVAGSGSAAFSDGYANNTPLRAWYGATGNSATASTFGSTEIYVPSYRASQNKPVGMFGLNETNATAATMAAVAGLWRNTAAITSILLDPLDGAASFVSGSSFWLYGVKNS